LPLGVLGKDAVEKLVARGVFDLNTEQKAQAAEMFGAEGSFLSAGKKLIDTSHAAFKSVTSVRSSIQQYCRAMTVPYPEPSIRLIRRDEIQMFDIKLASLKQEREKKQCRCWTKNALN
jgi:hypothetical protein